MEILMAILLDFIMGDPYGFPHPVVFLGKLIRKLENYFRNIFKKETALKLAGLIIVLIICIVSYGAPYIVLTILKPIPLLHFTMNILILWTTIAAKCLHMEAIKVFKALKRGDIDEARKKLSYIVGRETINLNKEDIIRADVETVAENTSDGVVAPLFFAVLGGAPLAMLYKGINTMDSMLGYRTEKYKDLGYFPAKADDIFNFIPARITGVLICILAPIVSGSIFNSFKIMIRDRNNHKSPNCAFPEGAVAGALNIQLGGTNTYFGVEVYKPTIGDKIKDISYTNIVQSIYLMYGAEVLFLILYLVTVYL